MIGVSYILYDMSTLFPVTAQHGTDHSSVTKQNDVEIGSYIVSVKVGRKKSFMMLAEPVTAVLKLQDTEEKVKNGFHIRLCAHAFYDCCCIYMQNYFPIAYRARARYTEMCFLGLHSS